MLLLVLSNMAKVSNKFNICAINSSERKAQGLDFSFDTFFYSWTSIISAHPLFARGSQSEGNQLKVRGALMLFVSDH